MGASVVNALSAELVATSKRDGSQWEQRFRRGPAGGEAAGSSAVPAARAPRCSSAPIRRYSRRTEFDPAAIAERLEVVSYLHKGVRVAFDDEVRGEKRVFQHADGLQDYLAHIVAARARGDGARAGLHAWAGTTTRPARA